MLIFVQIAAYRDSLLGSTIRDMLEKAGFPENLRITICHQYHPQDTFNVELDAYRQDYRFNIIDIPYYESGGLCWARNLIQQQYNGEKYTLQIDSHMRFIWDWDTILIDMLSSLQEEGYRKPILTAYPPHFEPNEFEYKDTPPNQIIFREFDKYGIYPITWPAEIPNWKTLTAPIPARFLAGGFTFSIGELCKEIPNDPDLYFSGEEINIAVRAYTHGYDLFHPHINITWHYYTRQESPKHWEDNGSTEAFEIHAMERLRRFFKSGERESQYNAGIYGLGKVRTLRDYERYAGILFGKRQVQKYTLECLPAPNPQLYLTEEAWVDSFYCCVNNHLHFPRHFLLMQDYDFAAINFMADNDEVHRMSLNENDLQKMTKSNDKYCSLEVKFYCRKLPDRWEMSLHSASGGWEKKIKGRMPYFMAGLGSFAINKCLIK